MKLLVVCVVLIAYGQHASSVKPHVSYFVANNQQKELIIETGTRVDFVCRGQGDPKPTISVQGQRSSKTIELNVTTFGGKGVKGVGSDVMMCADSDVYVCKVHNSNGAMMKNISILVKCRTQLSKDYDPGLSNVLIPRDQTEVRIEIPVIGLPFPADFSLYKVLPDYETEELFQFNAGVRPGFPPYSTVILSMYQLTSEDSDGSYVLEIGNGIGQRMKYEFTIRHVASVKVPRTENGTNTTKQKEIHSIFGEYGQHWIAFGAFILMYIICFLGCARANKDSVTEPEEDLKWTARTGRLVGNKKKSENNYF